MYYVLGWSGLDENKTAANNPNTPTPLLNYTVILTVLLYDVSLIAYSWPTLNDHNRDIRGNRPPDFAK